MFYDKVLAIDPNNVHALNRKLGKYTGAIVFYDKAVAIQPNNIYPLDIRTCTKIRLSYAPVVLLCRTML